jgi:hypothetical protein
MRKFNLNVPIVKVDEEQRMVYGYATMEEIDSQGEIVDYDASKVAFSNWIGNIREQHDDKKAVGKAIDIRFDDENRGVWLGSRISESADGENTWTKIKEGVLTGYSIGGMINSIKDEVVQDAKGIPTTITRIMDYVLGEVSVVDSPALGKFAEFAVVKSKDGSLHTTDVLDSTEKMFAAPWWMQKFSDRIGKAQISYNNSSKDKNMSNVKKSIWTADWLIDLACQLYSYIQSKQYEGEDTAELEKALETIKAAVVQEMNEPSKDLTIAVEMATKIVDIKKGDNMSEVKKEEVKKEEVTTEEEEVETKTEATEEVATEEETKTEESEETATEDSEKEEAEEVDESEKSTKSTDLEKATESDMSKLIDVVSDLRKEVAKTADLQKSVDDLKSQVEEFKKMAAPAKAKAEYATVEKSEPTERDQKLAEMEKQAKEYANDASLGTPTERSEFVEKYMAAKRKA